MSEARLGLAPGGGAALGAAHIGVLRALAERGIRPEIVTGTSAGALVGAALPLDLIEEKVRAASWARNPGSRASRAGSAPSPPMFVPVRPSY